MTVSPNPVFRFSGQSFTVKVENVAHGATRQEILKLFSALIGDVHRCDEYCDDVKRRIFEIEFGTPDAAKKALCMSGYTILGVPLLVSPAPPSVEPYRQTKEIKHGDHRRNLYVLGLPFDLTKSEFMEIFSRYGSVCHAVILATVDNASRRRGFVVMSSNKEAKLAMDALSRKEIKGHTIDVSWAVVQRSQGFLDGGDRTMAMSQQAPTVAPDASPFGFGPLDVPSADHLELATPPETCMPPINTVLCPASTLLITNLPAVLFSQVVDLDPLLRPYGDILSLKISPEKPEEGTVSVYVEYKTATQAKEAYDALSGQRYTNQPVKVEFVHLNVGETSIWSAKSDLKAGLNPLAAPFLVQSNYPSDHLALSSGDYMSKFPGYITRNGSPYLEARGQRSSLISDLCGNQLTTHRPHSAPSHHSPPGFNSNSLSGIQTCSTRYLPSFPSTSLRSSFAA